jgi:hypothetical protein
MPTTPVTTVANHEPRTLLKTIAFVSTEVAMAGPYAGTGTAFSTMQCKVARWSAGTASVDRVAT